MGLSEPKRWPGCLSMMGTKSIAGACTWSSAFATKRKFTLFTKAALLPAAVACSVAWAFAPYQSLLLPSLFTLGSVALGTLLIAVIRIFPRGGPGVPRADRSQIRAEDPCGDLAVVPGFRSNSAPGCCEDRQGSGRVRPHWPRFGKVAAGPTLQLAQVAFLKLRETLPPNREMIERKPWQQLRDSS